MTVHRSIRPLFTAADGVALLAGAVGAGAGAGAEVPVGRATLSGTVADNAGRPDRDRLFLCEPHPQFTVFCISSSSTASGPDGSYEFASDRGRHLPADGLSPCRARRRLPAPWSTTVTVAPGSTTTTNIALGLGGKVSGQVRLPDGTPVLSCMSISNEPVNLFSGSDAAQSDPVTGQYLSWRAVAGPTATGSGRPGLPGYFGSMRDGVPITPGATTTGVDLVLDPGGLVQGVVRGPQGEPVSGASVSAFSTINNCSPCLQPVATASDGSFSMAAPTGPLAINVTPPPATTYVAANNIPAIVTTGGTTNVSVTLTRASTVVATLTGINGPLAGTNAPIACAAPNTLNTANPSISFPCMQPDTTPALSVGTFGPGPTLGTFQINALPSPGHYNVYGVSVVSFGSSGPPAVPAAYRASPVASIDILPGDLVNCTFVVDMDPTGPTTARASAPVPPAPRRAPRTPPPWVLPAGERRPSPPLLVPPSPVRPPLTPQPRRRCAAPRGLASVRGLLVLDQRCGTRGTADVTLTYPAVSPAPNGYAKFVGGIWQDASAIVVPGSATAGSITIRLTDGGPFDTNPAPGVIGDPGGPALVDARLRRSASRAPPTAARTPSGRCRPRAAPPPTSRAAPVSGSPACTVSVTGGNANGVGTFTATASATDLAGNSASVTRTYRVVYAVDALRVPFSKVLTTSPVAGAGVAGVPFPVTVTAGAPTARSSPRSRPAGSSR